MSLVVGASLRVRRRWDELARRLLIVMRGCQSPRPRVGWRGALPGGLEAGSAGTVHVVTEGVTDKEDGGGSDVEPVGGELKDEPGGLGRAGALRRNDGGHVKRRGFDGGGDVIGVAVRNDRGRELLGESVDGVDCAFEGRGLSDSGGPGANEGGDVGLGEAAEAEAFRPHVAEGEWRGGDGAAVWSPVDWPGGFVVKTVAPDRGDVGRDRGAGSILGFRQRESG